jgi:hypothetical protein
MKLRNGSRNIKPKPNLCYRWVPKEGGHQNKILDTVVPLILDAACESASPHVIRLVEEVLSKADSPACQERLFCHVLRVTCKFVTLSEKDP